MGWRDRRISRLIKKYAAEVSVTRLPDVGISNPKAYQNKPRAFVIPTDDHNVDVQLSFADKCDAEIAVVCRHANTEDVVFESECNPLRLLSGESAKATSVNFSDFQLKIRHCSFQKIRREKEPLLPVFGEPRTPRPRLKTIKPPPRPPSFSEVDLDERLRWLLTPPINELLSDPQLALPARPFPFQTIGVKWLYDRHNALLADEMGLGKTMQAIIAARLLWRERVINQILIICPKSLIPTWQAEIKKWWPQVTPNVMLVGPNRQFFLRLGTPNVIIKIINYESIAREAEWLQQQRFSHDLVVIDEAQRIKSPTAKTSLAVKALEAERRWALTGTPLENRIEDLVSIFDFVRPGLFRNREEDLFGEHTDLAPTGGTTVPRMIAPHLLRRRAEDVLPELPEKSEQDVKIELGVAQRETYDRMETEGVIELNARGDSITVTHIFALINRLRQICNFDPVTGASAKFEYLLEDIEEVSASGRKALIFSQFVAEPYGLKKVSEKLEKYGQRVLELHGRIPQNRRGAVIKAFESDPEISALLLNFAVGGVGLNLQVANYVFLFDRWWNPAVEDQAVKRVHRIGQTQKVFIKRFYCKETIEERILQKLSEKRRLFRNIIDDARPEPDSLGLTEEEIFSLFNLTIRPRRSSRRKDPVPLVFESMDPTQFEIMVAEVYERQGYVTHLSGGSHDAGIDVLAEKENAAGMERVVIQCKHQKANVGRPVLQQLWGVVAADQSVTRGDLVTSSNFSSHARDFARGKRLTLIAGEMISKLARDLGVVKWRG